MEQGYTEQILEVAQTKGLFRPKDLEGLGIPRVYLSRMVEAGKLEHIARGVYALPGYSGNTSLGVVAKRVPDGVICLLSALQFHELTTQYPWQVWVAVEFGSRTPKLDAANLRVVRYKRESLEAGVEVHEVEGVKVKVFGVAKTIADCFKYRSQVGLDVALEALKEGWRYKRFKVDELLSYAQINRVDKVIRPYLEAEVA